MNRRVNPYNRPVMGADDLWKRMVDCVAMYGRYPEDTIEPMRKMVKVACRVFSKKEEDFARAVNERFVDHAIDEIKFLEMILNGDNRNEDK